MRGLIRAELERQGARPVARQTLALMVEAALEPAEGIPGYRIVDRQGTPRLRGVPSPGASDQDDQGRSGKGQDRKGAGRKGQDGKSKPDRASGAPGADALPGPLTLSDLVAELRARHPALFVAPQAPEPEPPARDTVAEVRAAGARFVETQSALARSLATSSAERSRALASAASETFEDLRGQLTERLKGRPDEAPGEAAPLSGSAGATQRRSGPRAWPAAGLNALDGAIVRLRAGSNRLADAQIGGRARDSLRGLADPQRLRDGFGQARNGLGGRGAALIGLGTGVGLALAALLVLPARETSSPPTETAATRSDPAPADPAQGGTATAPVPAQPPQTSPQGGALDPADNPPAEEPVAPAEVAPRNPNALVGVPEVIDTATLRIAGKVVHLFGVEWVRGGQNAELAKYLNGRTVTCQQASGSANHVCTVEGRDLSEVVLFNGGGRASPEANPDLVAAEDHARTERLGVWKR